MNTKHIIHITTPPVRSGKKSTPDGAICGNGDLAVILGNAPDGLRLYLSKCDLWEGIECEDAGGLKPLGYIDIPVRADLYAQYDVEQDLDTAQLRCRFAAGNAVCALTITVHKTENSLCIRSTGSEPVTPVLHVFDGETGRKGDFTQDGVQGIFRIWDGDDHLYETHVYAAAKMIGGDFYFFAATNHDVSDPRGTTVQTLQRTDAARLDELRRAHDAAWQTFWAKSAFRCADASLETAWYASQYYLAVCAGNLKFPPGLFANFITVEHPDWHSDYHLNYNYQAPFYAACSSNHAELTDGYMTPLEEFLERGASFAQRFDCGGILYPVGIGPRGMCTEMDHKLPRWFERLFLGQKNNQIHPADIPIYRWRATRDTDYAREHAYPFLKECLAFFEDYGTWEADGRFSVLRDAAHEVPIYREDFTPEKYKKVLNDKNNVVTLGLLHLGLDNAIDMARALGVDADKVRTWEKMRAHLSPFPTCRRFGQKVFRYTEKGQRWNETGDVGLQHIYPGGCIGLSSPPKTLRIARTTFRMKKRCCYKDDNAVTSFYPMAARLGENPKRLLRHLRRLMAKYCLPNLLYRFGGGCLEYCSIAANTLNEMVLQSHQDTVRIFPCWDPAVDCAFENLRADGAFLVSASIRAGVYGDIRIVCEKGGVLQAALPYSGARILHGGKEQIADGNTFTLETQPGDEIRICRRS